MKKLSLIFVAAYLLMIAIVAIGMRYMKAKSLKAWIWAAVVALAIAGFYALPALFP